jgi:hypothetical protein
MFPLDFVHKVEVWFVEVMYTYVPVLSATGISGSLRVHSDIVEGTKVATHATDFLHKDLVVEACFKLSLSCRCSSNVHGSLSSTEDDIVFYGCDGGAVQWGIGDV